MKKLTIFALLCGALSACDPGDDDDNFTSGVVSQTAEATLSELLVSISADYQGSDYLATDQIYNAEFTINENSIVIPESKIQGIQPHDTINGTPVSDEATSFYFIEGIDNRPDTYTAGGYAEMLNGFLNLQPGDYLCVLEGFQYVNTLGDTIDVDVYDAQVFSVEVGQQSAFIGEFNAAVE